MEDTLILVDLEDRETGTGPKLQVHRENRLHRAFSVFIVDGDRMLIQRRAFDKYHSGGLWANACCSHPRAGEKLSDAVQRRLAEELGIEAAVRELFSFVYFQQYDGLSEYEYDHVFLAEYNGDVRYDRYEVEEVMWIELSELARDVTDNPQKYCTWFIIALPEVLKYLRKDRSERGI
ncbi:MAG: isopentenyl-diphosphate Delta-isomerase [Lachnospiraceae bacterium]|nr:isopentenyl-diphosphate Delta-isomerase [Lachnospiraceae bacterium]